MDDNTIITKINGGYLADQNEVMLPEETIKRIFSDYPGAIKNTEKWLLEEIPAHAGLILSLVKIRTRRFFITPLKKTEKDCWRNVRKGCFTVIKILIKR